MIRYNPEGLTSREVAESRERHGDNVITPPKDDSAWRLLAEKFRDPIIRILLLHYLRHHSGHLRRILVRVGRPAAFPAAQPGQ